VVNNQFQLSLQSETLIRFLAAPRAFQLQYCPDSDAKFGYEGRESHAEVDGGLPLVFLVGEDRLMRDYFRLDGDRALAKSLFHIASLCRFASESNMMPVLAFDNDDVIETYASGVWQILRQFAQEVLRTMDLDGRAPPASYEDVFLAECFLLSESA
jgi:hypothetical protein